MNQAVVATEPRLRLRGGSAVVGIAATLLAVAVLAAAATVALAVVLPPTGSDDSALSRVTVIAFVLGMTALSLVGAVLVRRRPEHPMGWWMLVTGLVAVLSRLVSGYAAATDSAAAGSPPLLLWTTNWIWIPAQVAALEVLLRFPDGRLPSRRWAPVELLLLGWGAVTTSVTMLLPGPLGQTNLSHLDNPFGAAAWEPVLQALLGPLFAGVPLLGVVCALSLVMRWRGSRDEERQQLRWIAAAAGLIALAAPFAVLGDVPGLLLALAFVSLPAAICIAVLRLGLWNLGVVIRRTAVYALAVAVLGSGYVAVLAAVDSTPARWTAGLLVALLAAPVRDLAEKLLERWLFGHRGDPGLVARRLAERLAESNTSVLDGVAAQLRHSLRLPYVAVTGVDGLVHAQAGTLTAGHSSVRVPLVVSGTPVGWLVAQERAPREGLGPRDTALLEQVAQPAGLAVHASRLDADLRASHERLRSVREAERGRLRRDLHDGLGPTLGAIGMLAEAARNIAAATAAPEQLTAVLTRIEDSAEGAVVEVRRVIEDLLPESLEQHGLRRALLEGIEAQLPGVAVSVRLPDVLPRLDVPTEVATYRIAVEAMRNVRRHSRASTCSVSVDVRPDVLQLEVCDDGVGLRGAQPGVGLTSMATRAADLGGVLETGSGDGGRGTRVTARLPVAVP